MLIKQKIATNSFRSCVEMYNGMVGSIIGDILLPLKCLTRRSKKATIVGNVLYDNVFYHPLICNTHMICWQRLN